MSDCGICIFAHIERWSSHFCTRLTLKIRAGRKECGNSHPAVQNVVFDKGSTLSHYLVSMKCIPELCKCSRLSGIVMTKQWHPFIGST